MHLKKQEAIKYVLGGKIHHAVSNSRSKGVMIGIAQNTPWVLSQDILDKEGHFVFLKGKLNSLSMVMVQVYAPTKQQKPFWDELLGQLVSG